MIIKGSINAMAITINGVTVFLKLFIINALLGYDDKSTI